MKNEGGKKKKKRGGEKKAREFLGWESKISVLLSKEKKEQI